MGIIESNLLEHKRLYKVLLRRILHLLLSSFSYDWNVISRFYFSLPFSYRIRVLAKYTPRSARLAIRGLFCRRCSTFHLLATYLGRFGLRQNREDQLFCCRKSNRRFATMSKFQWRVRRGTQDCISPHFEAKGGGTPTFLTSCEQQQCGTIVSRQEFVVPCCWRRHSVKFKGNHIAYMFELLLCCLVVLFSLCRTNQMPI